MSYNPSRTVVAPNLERMFRVCNFTVSGDTLREDAISSLVLPDSNNGKISLSLFVSLGGKCKSEGREIARASMSFLTRFDGLRLSNSFCVTIPVLSRVQYSTIDGVYKSCPIRRRCQFFSNRQEMQGFGRVCDFSWRSMVTIR